ncbi:HDIG domain-containing protein [bacterium]|nr:HDIG domain-containing protein [candidate division CSSED10-310 bacterium]
MINRVQKQISRFIVKKGSEPWMRWFLMAGLVVVFAYALTPRPSTPVSTLQVGEKVWDDIRSGYDFTVIDEETTRQRKDQAEASVLPVYDFDNRLQSKLEQRITEIFNEWRQILRDRRLVLSVQDRDDDFMGPPKPPRLHAPGEAESKHAMNNEDDDYRQFLTGTGVKISEEIFLLLRELEFSYSLEEPIQAILSDICSYAIIANRDLLQDIAKNGLIRRDMISQDERVIHNLDTIISLDVAYREVDNSAARVLPDNQLLQDISADLVRALIRPNLTYNMQETQKRRIVARDTVKPVFFQVAAGEVIVAAGDRVTPEIKLRLDQLNKLGKESRLGLIFAGNMLVMLLLAGLIVFYLRKFHPNLETNRYVLIGLVSLIHLLLCQGISALSGIIPEYMTRFPMDSPVPYRYAIPFALGSMLLALLIGARIGVFFNFIYGMISAMILGGDFMVGLFAVLSGYSAVFAVSQYKHRTMILQGGFLISIANGVAVIVLQLVQGEFNGMLLALSALMGLAGGLLVAMIVTILLPILEWMFKIPTDIRLLELSNFNEPLLRKLAMEAPGTHHHSLMVGDLAEAAAEAIGANALLAKVGAYYHDIGKIAQPQYFIENITGTNPHDKLTPNMSSMIIRKHVKQGVEMARRAGLGSDLIDIIEQHHGDSLVTFFYRKACDDCGKTDSGCVSEESFRYSGPCPRSKEAAIVLIADSVEAAARSMKSPSPSSLKTMVETVTYAKFRDHQFDHCELTFRELTIIAERLYDRLLRNMHSRIEYPGFNFSDQKSANPAMEMKGSGRRSSEGNQMQEGKRKQ